MLYRHHAGIIRTNLYHVKPVQINCSHLDQDSYTPIVPEKDKDDRCCVKLQIRSRARKIDTVMQQVGTDEIILNIVCQPKVARAQECETDSITPASRLSYR